MIGRRARSVLGVGISSGAVRALVLRDGAVTWTRELVLDADRSLRDALDALLTDASGRARIGRAGFAVGPATAQLRRLRGLPAVRDATVLGAIVQESAGRYFRQNGIPIRTTPAAEWRDGTAWVGAIEVPVVETVGAACRAARLSTASIAPAAALLGHAAPGARLVWIDGDVVLDARYDAVSVAECRCVPATLADAPEEGVALDPALAALGADAIRFADAFAAARAGALQVLALDPMRNGAVGGPMPRRLAVASAACGVALLFALAAPVIASARVEQTATDRLARVARASEAGDRVGRLLADSARTLADLAAFQRSGRSMTFLLASLTCAVTEPAMLTSLRLDTAGGLLTALTPSAAALVEMLGRVPEVESPTIVGSVTGEAQAPPPPPGIGVAPGQTTTREAPRTLERVTVRFQWRAKVAVVGASKVCGE